MTVSRSGLVATETLCLPLLCYSVRLSKASYIQCTQNGMLYALLPESSTSTVTESLSSSPLDGLTHLCLLRISSSLWRLRYPGTSSSAAQDARRCSIDFASTLTRSFCIEPAVNYSRPRCTRRFDYCDHRESASQKVVVTLGFRHRGRVASPCVTYLSWFESNLWILRGNLTRASTPCQIALCV